MKTLKTIGLVLFLLILIAANAVSPWWMIPINAICLCYLGREIGECLILIWSPRTWVQMQRHED